MALEQRIQSLRKRRDEIKMQIHAELARPATDTAQLHQLKKENLFLKDEEVRLRQIQQAA